MKSIFASKTFWWNALTGAATVLGMAQNVIPENYAPYITAGVALVNVGLRLVTSTPVSVTGNTSTNPQS